MAMMSSTRKIKMQVKHEKLMQVTESRSAASSLLVKTKMYSSELVCFIL